MKSRYILMLSSVLFPIGSAQVCAQATKPDAPAVQDGSAEIIVTAQRREQRLQDVPVSVAVATGETLQKRGVTDLVDLSERMPGLKLSTDPQANHINIRGVGSGLNAGFEQSVGTFIDGVYRGRSRSIQAGLFDVERVEVLNGPQTIFFGNNTVAGAINVTTKKPQEKFGYDAQALYSPSDGQYLAQVGVTGPITDTLSARAAVQFTGMNGYTYNDNLKVDEPHNRDFVGRVSFRWKPASNFQSDLRIDYAHNRDRGSYSAEITGCPPASIYGAAKGPCLAYLNQHNGTINSVLDFNSLAGPSSFSFDMVEAAWTNRLDLGKIRINAITSYNHQKSSTFLNATPLPVFGVAGYYYSPFSENEVYNDFAQELRLESTGGGWLQYVAGLYYSHGDLTTNSYSSLYGSSAFGAAGAPVTNASTPIGTNRNLYQTDQTRSAFAQVTASPVEHLKINAGLRYTSVKKDASRSFFTGISGPTANPSDFMPLPAATQALINPVAGGSNANFVDPHTTYNKLMPSANIQYTITPAVSSYISWTRGFKAGGYSDANTPSQFNSENVDAYEIGVKGSALDRKVFYTFDLFYEDYKGLQQSLTVVGPTGANITSVGNAASSVSKGVEGSLSVRATDFLSLNAAGTYIDSYFKSYTGAGCTALGVALTGASCIQDLSGHPTPFAPKYSGSVGVTVTVPVRGDIQARLDPNLFYSSSYFLTSVDDPIVKQGDYTQVDLRLGVGPADRRWEFAVIAKNLGNTRVAASGSTIATSPGLAYFLLQRARSVAISFSIKH